MYQYGNGQISLSDFQQPMGMCLREDNRWVKKAQLLPWDKIGAKYVGLFPSATGKVAKPLQLALGACLIQREYGYSDEEIVLQIQENPYLQYSVSPGCLSAGVWHEAGYQYLKRMDETGIPFF